MSDIEVKFYGYTQNELLEMIRACKENGYETLLDHIGTLAGGESKELSSLRTRVQELEAENKGLREFIEKHSGHHEDCSEIYDGAEDCDCGYDYDFARLRSDASGRVGG